MEIIEFLEEPLLSDMFLAQLTIGPIDIIFRNKLFLIVFSLYMFLPTILWTAVFKNSGVSVVKNFIPYGRRYYIGKMAGEDYHGKRWTKMALKSMICYIIVFGLFVLQEKMRYKMPFIALDVQSVIGFALEREEVEILIKVIMTAISNVMFIMWLIFKAKAWESKIIVYKSLAEKCGLKKSKGVQLFFFRTVALFPFIKGSKAKNAKENN